MSFHIQLNEYPYTFTLMWLHSNLNTKLTTQKKKKRNLDLQSPEGSRQAWIDLNFQKNFKIH